MLTHNFVSSGSFVSSIFQLKNSIWDSRFSYAWFCYRFEQSALVVLTALWILFFSCLRVNQALARGVGKSLTSTRKSSPTFVWTDRRPKFKRELYLENGKTPTWRRSELAQQIHVSKVVQWWICLSTEGRR